MKKIVGIMVSCLLVSAMFLGGCGKAQQADGQNGGKEDTQATGFDKTKEISVVSREDGSGTRGAFIELFGVEEKDEKVDNTTEDANITNSTSVMMTTVSGNPYAIGYISLGSLNDTVKAVKIDGKEATVENIKSGSYKIARPFQIATKSGISEVAQDFIKYIMSADGQAVVEGNGFISASQEPAYTPSKLSGKIVVAGSSSVTPVMEKLKEAYILLNPNVSIGIQESDSTTGMISAIEGICDIGMASRDLKDSEIEKGLNGTVIALDGIAVIVHKENTTTELTTDKVKGIFTGKDTKWSDVVGK